MNIRTLPVCIILTIEGTEIDSLFTNYTETYIGFSHLISNFAVGKHYIRTAVYGKHNAPAFPRANVPRLHSGYLFSCLLNNKGFIDDGYRYRPQNNLEGISDRYTMPIVTDEFPLEKFPAGMDILQLKSIAIQYFLSPKI